MSEPEESRPSNSSRADDDSSHEHIYSDASADTDAMLPTASTSNVRRRQQLVLPKNCLLPLHINSPPPSSNSNVSHMSDKSTKATKSKRKSSTLEEQHSSILKRLALCEMPSATAAVISRTSTTTSCDKDHDEESVAPSPEPDDEQLAATVENNASCSMALLSPVDDNSYQSDEDIDEAPSEEVAQWIDSFQVSNSVLLQLLNAL